jgi:hypothetical protein
LWQAWKRGERSTTLPWFGLLAAFCMVLAAMYAFFVFSAIAGGDPFLIVIMTFVFLAFFVVIWRRVSPRRGFALAVVALMVALSLVVFLLWLLAYSLTGWNPWAAIGGTILLGIAGIAIGLPSLDAIAKGKSEA